MKLLFSCNLDSPDSDDLSIDEIIRRAKNDRDEVVTIKTPPYGKKMPRSFTQKTWRKYPKSFVNCDDDSPDFRPSGGYSGHYKKVSPWKKYKKGKYC